MTDFHIEFGHIYKDQMFAQEQIESIHILKEITSELDKDGSSYQTSVLIDDYHIKRSLWEVPELIAEMKLRDVMPDIVVSEGALLQFAEDMIETIPSEYKRMESFRKEKKTVTFYVNGDKKFALKDTYADRVEMKCVSLSTVWMMCKLGIIPCGNQMVAPIICGEGIKASDGVITILDKKYMSVESHVMELLDCLGYEEQKKAARYIFI